MLHAATAVSITFEIPCPVQDYCPIVTEGSERSGESDILSSCRSPAGGQVGLEPQVSIRQSVLASQKPHTIPPLHSLSRGGWPLSTEGTLMENNAVRSNRWNSLGKKSEAIWISTKHIVRRQITVADTSWIQETRVGLSKPKTADGKRITVALPSNPWWLFLCKLSPPLAVKRNAFQDTDAFIAFLSSWKVVLLSSSARTWIFLPVWYL